MQEKIKVLELFGGIGACTNALRNLKIPHEVVDYVEIDKYAVKSYNAIYGTNFNTQDIKKWDKDIEVDLIMHGSPCQDFSIAGKQAGGTRIVERDRALCTKRLELLRSFVQNMLFGKTSKTCFPKSTAITLLNILKEWNH